MSQATKKAFEIYVEEILRARGDEAVKLLSARTLEEIDRQ